ncbi:EAL domain-containing protein [Chelatococcus sp. SYSU_G07232]|uniref:EAL domain-containing protein n=1 Tax=Chelatococcus albus TaxID=3047466 RepID=A0ABT7AET7_9HYPH|nr:EAL domain-containing protein [Chelatococcus sp. SYSU_G07232]MDJ1157889.1 EAL domain-containing protein [Chelatococcus sp. SYSU_G07232]
MRATLAELTAEIGLLGGLMKDVAETVAAHDRQLNAPGAQSALAGPGAHPALAAPEGGDARTVRTAGGDPAGAPARRREALLGVRREKSPGGDGARVEAIARALAEDRVELHLQPVVTLPQRKIRLYEALSRLQCDEGEVLVPAEFLPVAERRGLVAQLDQNVVTRAVKVARHLAGRGAEALVSCNLSPAAIAETGFLRSIVRIVSANADTAGRLVFELPQRTLRHLDAERAGALAELAACGVRFAMDHVTDLRLDPLDLAERGVRFVKVPAAMMLSGAANGAAIDPADLAAMLGRAGIALIVEQVETEAAVVDLLDLNVPLAQGFLFAPPRPVRAEVFGGPRAGRPAAPPAREPAPRPARLAVPSVPVETPPVIIPAAQAEATERKPFRAFLRRASA